MCSAISGSYVTFLGLSNHTPSHCSPSKSSQVTKLHSASQVTKGSQVTKSLKMMTLEWLESRVTRITVTWDQLCCFMLIYSNRSSKACRDEDTYEVFLESYTWTGILRGILCKINTCWDILWKQISGLLGISHIKPLCVWASVCSRGSGQRYHKILSIFWR